MHSQRVLALLTAPALLASAMGFTMTAQAASPTTVTFWNAMSSGTLKPALNTLIAEFNRTHPAIQVVGVAEPNYGVLEQKLLASIAAGNPPVMSQAYENWVANFANDGALVPLTGYIHGKNGLTSSQIKDFWSILWRDGQLKGVQWMIPFNKSDIVLYYNKTMFKQAGIKAPPTTWPGFVKDAKKLTSGSHWGVTFVPGTNASGGEEQFESMIASWGGHVTNKSQTRLTIDTKAAIEPLTMLRDMVKAGTMKLSTGYGDQSDFGAQKAAMIIGTVAGYYYVKKADGGKFPMGIAMLPAGPKGIRTAIQGTNLVIYKHATSAQRQAAWTFIKWLTTPGPAAYWAVHTGYLPVTKTAYHHLDGYYKSHPNQGIAALQLKDGYFEPANPNWQHVADKIAQNVDACLLGKESPAQAMKLAQQQGQPILSGQP